MAFNFSLFKDPSYKFSVVVFITNDAVSMAENELVSLSNQRNVKLITQICPYEGIEFLYQIQDQLNGHAYSSEKEIFWEALKIKKETSENILNQIGETQLQLLVSILQNNVSDIKTYLLNLQQFNEHFEIPIG